MGSKMFLTKRYLNVSLYIWLSFIILSLLFIFFPQIDLDAASFFYDGESFILKGTPFEVFFFQSVRVITGFMILSYLFIIVHYFITKQTIFNISKKVLLYIFLVLSIAPGLIVNSVLKEHMGRARPVDIVQFGGNKEFTPAFIPSNQGGNSFTSGHAAAAFSLTGFALLASRKRQLWMGVALSYGVAVIIARMGAGGHFLSDNITSFFIVFISTHILYKIIFKKDSL